MKTLVPLIDSVLAWAYLANETILKNNHDPLSLSLLDTHLAAMVNERRKLVAPPAKRKSRAAASAAAAAPDAEPISVVVVRDGDRQTLLYVNGLLRNRKDSNDAFEVARLTEGRPCVVETRVLPWWRGGLGPPMYLHEVPEG